MRKIILNSGFAILPVLVIVIVLGVLGVSVYQVQQNQNIVNKAYDQPPDPTEPPPQDQLPVPTPEPTPNNNCGGVREGDAIRTCVTGCPAGMRGTCGGHVYCEGGSPGGCQCETEDQTCRPEDLRSCPIGECFEGDCVPTETYWECDSSCGDRQERQISKQRSGAGGCDYVKGGCRANSSCGDKTGSKTPQPSGNQMGEKGDVDGNGKTDGADLGIIIENFGKFLNSVLPFDLDKDKDVDIVDFGIWRDSFQKSL